MGKSTILFGSLACICLLLVGAGCSASDIGNTNPDEDTLTQGMQEDVQVNDDTSSDDVDEEAMEAETEEATMGQLLEPSDEEGMEPIGEDVSDMVVDVEIDTDTDTDDVVMDAVQFNITGDNFSFSQKELRVSEGSNVTINFTSETGFHDWVIDEFDAATEQVKAGESSSVTFVANKAGTFEYYCSVGSHRQLGMVGTLIVE